MTSILVSKYTKTVYLYVITVAVETEPVSTEYNIIYAFFFIDGGAT